MEKTKKITAEMPRSMNAVPMTLKGIVAVGKGRREIIDWNEVMLCTPIVTLPAKKVHGTNAANMKIGYGMLPVSIFATLWNTSVAAAMVTSEGRMAQASPTIDCRYRSWYWRRTNVSIRYRWDQSPRNTGPRPVVAVDIISAILPSAGQLAAS